MKLLINGKNQQYNGNNGKHALASKPSSAEYNLSKNTTQIGSPINENKPELRGFNQEAQKSIRRLENLVGLSTVKHNIYEICAYIVIQNKRKEMGLNVDSQSLHMMFSGSPGTGKTTIARILGELFKSMNYLPEGHLIEVERADLVGEYIGQTAQKTKKQIYKALGGVLFIDEAYSLARGGSTDFGKEAIDTLVKAMEDYKDQLIVILAGYKNEMDAFIDTNPGLSSRFPIQINFPDYSVDQLIAIAKKMIEERDYRLDESAMSRLEQIIRHELSRNLLNFSNARFIRNLVERSIRHQAMRLMKQKTIHKKDLIYLRREDLF